MAVRTLTLNATKWAYVNRANPDTHYTISDSAAYTVGDDAKLLVGLQPVPSTLRRNRILRMAVTAQAKTSYNTEAPRFHVLFDDFNAPTVTYNTRPEWETSGVWALPSATYGQWLDYTADQSADTRPLQTTILEKLQKMVQYARYAVGGTSGIQVKTKTVAGSAALFTIEYDPDVILTSKPYPTDYPSGTADPRHDLAFEWELRKAQTGYYAPDESFTQVSAKLFWKLAEHTTWSEIAVSGGTTRAVIPADTLPTAKVIQWYIQATDTDGTTASSDVMSFSTPTNNIYFSDRPTGTEVDTRKAILFKWTLSGTFGDYDQESATLYWRASDEDPWNEITVGSEKEITVPALTFPTYATINWYLTATDTGGHTAVYAEQQFSTPTVKIAASEYPEGSDVSTRVAQVFSWRYSNAKYTDYTQASAVFYWQKVPSETWNTIQISGNVKTLTIPADTFPTSSKIRWYIVGTDAGDTTTKTGIRSFETVTTKITPQNCPTSGYWDPRNPITFSWYYSSALGDYSQQSAVLYWRESGATEWTEVPISGDVQTITVPALTFPVASEIEWYLAGTDTGGTTTETQVFTFSTTAATAYAICISPVGQVEDGTKPITFTWIVKNDDGSLPLRTVLEWKYDTESQLEWKTLLDTVDTATEYTVPGDTFSAGAVEWRVSAYNRDLVQGPANVASFVCLHSPDAPAGLAATPVPRTTVRWQAAGQEAYEVQIDGVTVAKAYGPSVYSYQQNEPLEDGEHVIAVRVQGQYGLWSNWSETTILVENSPGTAITLSGVFGIDAELVWTATVEDLNATMNVYRDGKWIAAVGSLLTFTDRLAIGEHSYFVEMWDSGGNYTRSNTVTGTTSAEETVIAEAAGGEWMRINLQEDVDQRRSFSWAKEYAVRNILGSPYPMIEVGPDITLIGRYSCAFPDIRSAMAFEQLLGKPVIIKSRYHIISGVIVNMSKDVLKFYLGYTFSIQQASLEDFINYET